MFVLIAIGCFTGAASGSRLQGRDTQLGLRAVLITNGLWLTFQALGLLTADGRLSSALYIGGLIWGLTGVGAWVYFIAAYTGRSYHRNRRYRALAIVVYVGLIAVKLTNPLYGLYVSTQLQQSPYPHLVVEPRLFYWVSFSLTYTLVAISFYWLLGTLRESSSQTASLAGLAVLSLFPVVPRVAVQALPSELLPPILLGLSFEPIGVTAFLLGVLVFVEEPFRKVEQSARSKFFEEADKATFVYDTSDNLVEVNKQAQRLQSALDIECPTIESFEQAFKPLDTDENDTVTVEIDGSIRHFDITTIQMTAGAENIGMVATVSDITERRARKRDLKLKERAMDEAKVGITISDPTAEDNPLVYVNDGFVEQTGYSRSESLGRNCRFLQADDRDQSALDDLREAIATNESITVLLRNYRKDGEQFWNRLSVTPVYDDTGKLVNHVGIQQDVTTVRDSQRELRAERERFELLIESTDEYAFLLVDNDGTIQTWNDGAGNLFGYDSATAVGMPMADLHPAADRETGLPDRLLGQARYAGEASDEGWRVRADGSAFYADVRYAALESDDGELQYAQIVRDMTEQRRQQRRTERFVEESDDVVTILDSDGTVTYASRSSDRVLGYDSDDLTGVNLFDQLHPDDRNQAMEAFFTGTTHSDATFQIDARLASEEGGWREMELRCRNMLDDDAIDGMLLYLRDVTTTNERNRRLEALFNGTFSFTGLLEPDGTAVKINDAALEFGGFDREAIIGEPFDEASWWTHSAAVQDRLRDALDAAAAGEFVRYETDVRGTAGLETIDFSVKPVTNEADEVTLLVVEGRVITNQSQQEQHMSMLERVMRHNVRNDLNKVRGWAQILAEEENAETRLSHLDRIKHVVDEWEAMTDGVRQIRQLANSTMGDRPITEVQSVTEHLTEWGRGVESTMTVESTVSDSSTVWVPRILEDAVTTLIPIAVDQSTDRDASVEVLLSDTSDDWIEVTLLITGSRLTEAEIDVLDAGEETALTHAQGVDVWLVRTMIREIGGDITAETADAETSVTLRIPQREPL
ncbi:MAG: PAS domain S-box protein [Halobellus sp.]|uniref:PAS domain S-box protein n=1 Tax=Halobellus sp. TaxID=1979212 RepID=UPI0035D461CA